jgi:hypothetical protein
MCGIVFPPLLMEPRGGVRDELDILAGDGIGVPLDRFKQRGERHFA